MENKTVPKSLILALFGAAATTGLAVYKSVSETDVTTALLCAGFFTMGICLFGIFQMVWQLTSS